MVNHDESRYGRATGGRQERRSFLPRHSGSVALVLAQLAATLMSGCDPAAQPGGSGEEGNPGFVVWDSAGVEVIENHSPEWPANDPWTIDPEPDIVLGGGAAQGPDSAGSGQVVWQVRGMARVADGRVVLLSSEDARLALYEPSGELSRTIGREGRGPGEFTRPQHLQYLPPDTLVVWDIMMGPVSYFDTDGTLLRSRSLDVGGIIAHGSGIGAQSGRRIDAESRVIPLADGSFVVVATRYDPNFVRSPGSMARDPAVEYLRIDEDYAAQAIASGKGEQIWFPEPVRGMSWPDLPTFLLDSHVAVGGSPLRIYTSDGDRNEIHQYSLDGDLVRVIRRTTDPVPVTGSAHRAWQDGLSRFFSTVGGDPDDPDMAEIFRQVPRPETFPSVAALLVDLEGYLWVREWSVGETGMPDQWSVFSPDGRWLGTLPSFPDPLGCHHFISPCWIGKDYLLAVRRDEFGDERVEGYRIRRGAS